MNIDIKTILIVVLIIFVINMFNKKSLKSFNENCDFEKFSDDVTSVLDSITQYTTESVPASDNSESLKTIDQINFESNYDIVDDSENTD